MGENALVVAVRRGHLEIVEFLLEGGMPPDWHRSEDHMTLLHWAVENRSATSTTMIKFLLDSGAGHSLLPPGRLRMGQDERRRGGHSACLLHGRKRASFFQARLSSGQLVWRTFASPDDHGESDPQLRHQASSDSSAPTGGVSRNSGASTS